MEFLLEKAYPRRYRKYSSNRWSHRIDAKSLQDYVVRKSRCRYEPRIKKREIRDLYLKHMLYNQWFLAEDLWLIMRNHIDHPIAKVVSALMRLRYEGYPIKVIGENTSKKLYYFQKTSVQQR